MVERKEAERGKKVRREVLPAGIPLWARPQGAQALQHAGQRPWNPLSGPPCGRGGGWEITYSACPWRLDAVANGRAAPEQGPCSHL
jgi:hypothetical protein